MIRTRAIGARLSIRQRCHSMLFVLPVIALVASGCASSSGSNLKGNPARVVANDKILTCKSTDRQVASSDQCLQDDAACYQISGGQWCTGERGNVCPAGSSPIAAGTPCPAGARCFRYSETLECKI